jgi:hypothetical protein
MFLTKYWVPHIKTWCIELPEICFYRTWTPFKVNFHWTKNSLLGRKLNRIFALLNPKLISKSLSHDPGDQSRIIALNHIKCILFLLKTFQRFIRWLFYWHSLTFLFFVFKNILRRLKYFMKTWIGESLGKFISNLLFDLGGFGLFAYFEFSLFI